MAYEKLVAIAMFELLKVDHPIELYPIVSVKCKEIAERCTPDKLDEELQTEAMNCHANLVNWTMITTKGFIPIPIFEFEKLDLIEKLKYLRRLSDYRISFINKSSVTSLPFPCNNLKLRTAYDKLYSCLFKH